MLQAAAESEYPTVSVVEEILPEVGPIIHLDQMQNLGGRPKDGGCSVNGPGPSHSRFRVLEDLDEESPSLETVVAQLTGPAYRGTRSKGETSRRAMQKNNTKKGQTQGDSGQAQLQKANLRIMEVRTPLAEVSNSHIQSNSKDKGVKRGSSITGNLIRPHSGDPPIE